ncbi:MAG: flagellar hook-length control protein FliK [Candidatus Brocadiae bacterium]|nr:flagellar hook-length control protein FliK [Candidatus Brocadiia bacterium]
MVDSLPPAIEPLHAGLEPDLQAPAPFRASAHPALAAALQPATTASGPTEAVTGQNGVSTGPIPSAAQPAAATATLRSSKLAAVLQPASVERIAAVVRAQALQGGGRVKLLLHPPHLGALKVEVTVRDGLVLARLEVESPQARHALEARVSELRDALEAQGLSLGGMEVSVGGGQEAEDGSAWTSPESHQAFPEVESAPADAPPEPRKLRLLDLTV